MPVEDADTKHDQKYLCQNSWRLLGKDPWLGFMCSQSSEASLSSSPFCCSQLFAWWHAREFLLQKKRKTCLCATFATAWNVFWGVILEHSGPVCHVYFNIGLHNLKRWVIALQPVGTLLTSLLGLLQVCRLFLELKLKMGSCLHLLSQLWTRRDSKIAYFYCFICYSLKHLDL